MLRREAREAGDDALEVFERKAGGQREGEEREARGRAHRGQIAQVDCERAMANCFRRDEGAIEVDAFDERVDAEDLDAVSLRLDHRGIVADADEQPVRRGRQMLLDAREERALVNVADGSASHRPPATGQLTWRSPWRAFRGSPSP